MKANVLGSARCLPARTVFAQGFVLKALVYVTRDTNTTLYMCFERTLHTQQLRVDFALCLHMYIPTYPLYFYKFLQVYNLHLCLGVYVRVSTSQRCPNKQASVPDTTRGGEIEA